ncbi:MAG TPA: hypothetical protein VFB66_26580 [Tepidisphaeraceae bacterium]|nr:hypothetical protein [Tepidisphaeraceae bacterium]
MRSSNARCLYTDTAPASPTGRRAPFGGVAERLEGRLMLSFTPGPVGRVNVSTFGEQFTTVESPAVASDADGDFVVAYTSSVNDSDVYVRRFDRGGNPKANEVRVNTTTAFNQAYASVASDAAGNFVVVWQSNPENGTGYQVYARRYSSAGQPLGGEFRVNTTTARVQTSAVAMNDRGEFVVTWTSNNAAGASLGVFGQRFNAAGARVGGEVRVDDSGGVDRLGYGVAMDAAGNFIATWQDRPTVPGDYSSYVRRFDASGAPRGAGVRLNEIGTLAYFPWPAMAPDGRSAVVWGEGPLHLPTALRARIYDAAGVQQGDTIDVASGTRASQSKVDMNAAGEFVVTWVENPFMESLVNTRAFDVAGQPLVEAQQANESDNASYPTVALDDEGDYVVVWTQFDADRNVYARQYLDDRPPAAAVVARHVFYNHSSFDGNDGAADARDDAAIATDKAALLPGQAPSFANVTSFSHGLNGVMVDVAGLPAGDELGPDDFEIGADGTRPLTVTVRRGEGTDGSDRVTLTWPDYDTPTDPPTIAVGNGWLRVTVKANERTGLAQPDTFSFGNLIGEIGDAFSRLRVSPHDVLQTRRNFFSDASVTSRFDFNRDGRVGVADFAISRAHIGRTLGNPDVPTAPAPALAAPPRGSDEDGVWRRVSGPPA